MYIHLYIHTRIICLTFVIIIIIIIIMTARGRRNVRWLAKRQTHN